ncbi:hypothetical protein [Roseovarius sp. M141]|uniref:hypothetical protein n=1 Tax=Roseovarius sp. M141 TaxID=2583806 RepID=UPI0020CC17E6|nr:hypothetical protein [Roseovarius sp. M141]MCQ0090502.1 hypothetical protein [Roseovarius sp. M141]
MGRPPLPPSQTRKRWDKLYATEAERAEISATARAADLTVSQYLIARHCGDRLHEARSGGAALQAMSVLDARLAEIAHHLAQASSPLDATLLHADLVAIERNIRHAVLPWAICVSTEDEGDAS